MTKRRLGNGMLIFAGAATLFGLMYGLANTWVEGDYIGWKNVLLFVGAIAFGSLYLITAVNLSSDR